MGEDKNKSLIIKIGCVIAAFFMWIYTSNESSAIQIRIIKDIPVQIINAESLGDSGLILSTNYDYDISLKVSGTAAAIYAAGAEQFKVVADLNGYILNEGLKKIPVEIVKSPESVNVVNDTTLWVEIKLDKLVTKTLPVSIHTVGSISDKYYQFDAEIEPSSVIVTGSEEYVNKIQNIYAELNIQDTTDDLMLTVPVVAVDSLGKKIAGVTINPSTVKVSIPVKKIKSVKVQISTKGILASGLLLNSITPEFKWIKITGDEELIKSIITIETEAIDLSKITLTSNKVTAKLVVPEGVKIVSKNEYIDIVVELDKIVEKNMTLNIESRNLKDDLTAKYTNESISLIISGAEKVLSKIDNESIKAFLDFTELNQGEYNMSIKFDKPDNINIISQNTQIIRVIVENIPLEDEIVNNINESNEESENTNAEN